MSHRISKVNELLKREIVTCVERSFEFPNVLVTIHAVETAPDLKSATVYVGVVGDESREQEVIDALNRRHGFIQSAVMKRVVLRCTPLLTFRMDKSVERGIRINAILDELEKEQNSR